MGSKKHKKHKSENKGGTDTEDGQEKPLKLVLNIKMGGQSSSVQDGQQGTASPSSLYEERGRHKHKKKKKKKSSDKSRERSREEEHLPQKRPYEDDDSNDDEDEQDEEEEEGRFKATDNDESDGNSSPSRKLREPRSCTLKGSDGVILKQMLNYLVKNLQNKDVNGFFAFPVTDTIAPGYSSIILHPMDFSTMTAKIESCEYANVMEFKKDFILMCNNAMTYNRPETIYYKEAKRLLHLGIRQLSKEKLLHLKKTQSFLSSITLQELGFDESGHVIIEQTSNTQARVDNQPHPQDEPMSSLSSARPERDIDRFDAIPDDDLSPEEILSQAQDAAQAAKNALTARKPKTDLGFLRMDDDGTTSMTILNPWNNGVVSSTQKVISLGDYMGKLKSGSGSLFKFKEDKRNKVCPETYLCYGPFSSHAPSYDSSFASCTKEESDLLLNTYGGEIGVQYAKSVQKFVENAGISAVEMVDKLLDTLTRNQHSKSQMMLEEQKRKNEEAAEKALQDEMISKAQKAAEDAAAKDSKDPVQQSLNQTAAMISDLYQTQNQRLSQDPPPHLGLIAQPSDKEADLANKVTSSLVSMARQVQPSDVVSTPAVRGAMGISPVYTSQQQISTVSLDSSNGVAQNQAAAAASKNKGRSMSDDSEEDDDVEDDSDEDNEEEEQEISHVENEDQEDGDNDKDEVDGEDGDDGDEEEGEDSEEEDMDEG
ncbi:hypothetical protein EGW08_022024 [Elysia chlorotica]|uniref:Bromo domain-containing protein n=1 Tax=Elysia chlorotica TaxID=188477 RepID=A0A433SM15_ELYCH|nr:hypothetical protein EGW08_022024 [Elysia chlorotica]